MVTSLVSGQASVYRLEPYGTLPYRSFNNTSPIQSRFLAEPTIAAAPVSVNPTLNAMDHDRLYGHQEAIQPGRAWRDLLVGGIVGFLASWGLSQRQLASPIHQASQKIPLTQQTSDVTQTVTKTLPTREKGLQMVKNELPKINFSYNNPLASLFDLFRKDPGYRKLIGVYVLASAGGYLASQLAEGYQEAMVRRAEVSIRQKLLDNLNQAFRKSLLIKETFDQSLRRQAKSRIRDLLKRYQIADPDELMAENTFVPESTQAVRGLLFERKPWHRPTPELTYRGRTASILFKANSSEGPLGTKLNLTSSQELYDQLTANPSIQGEPLSIGIKSLLDGTFIGLGGVVGAMVHQFNQSLKYVSRVKAQNQVSSFFYDLDALVLQFKKPQMVLGYGLAAGAVLTSKLLMKAVRDIWVTQLNADTEYQYQKYNWTQLDPTYHATAESVAFDSAFKRLEQSMPRLKTDRHRLRAQIAVLLENIGRMSAPKYFMMTPGVGLVEARS